MQELDSKAEKKKPKNYFSFFAAVKLRLEGSLAEQSVNVI